MKEKRNIVITGANSQLGNAIMRRATNDYDSQIIATTRSSADLSEFEKNKNITHLTGINLTKEQDINKLSQIVDEKFIDKFDIIHSVGNFWYHVPFKEYEMHQAKEMMESHYLTLYNVCYNLIPKMINNGGGHIIGFSCNSVKYNYPLMAAFTAAKAAVETLIKCIANEYSKDKIIANAFALASLQTNTVEQSKPFGDFENFMSTDAVAKAVLKINDEGFEYLNGNIINLFKYSDSFFNEGYLKRNKK